MRYLSVKTFILLFFLFQHSFTSGQKNSKPNIIYIMADDMGYADMSAYGRKDYQTPNLDKLAAQGIKFMNAYAAAPVCTPTRVAFMTGRYPSRTNVGLHEPLDWTTNDSLIGLTPEVPSVATLLKENGYETYLVGKWHL
ncbi:MAG TPA: sulfatase-like hydrolase/transferase, partial [Ferruginibacter sp.]|nr:sulfatase-like hydrolase/transferase [Ferruginibacter sp.]